MADKPRTTGVTQRWQYRVRLGAMEIAYFQKGNLPSKEIEESTFKPAGLIFDEKYPGRIKYNDITLEKGQRIGSDLEADEWFNSAADGPNNELGSAYTKQVELERLDRRGNVIDRLFCMKPGARRLNMTTLVMARLMQIWRNLLFAIHITKEFNFKRRFKVN